MTNTASRILLACCIWLCVLPVGIAQTVDTAIQYKTVKSILNIPESELNLLAVKLTIDRLIDPNVNNSAAAIMIDGMTESLKASLPPDATRQQKLDALRQFIYQPGPWNQNWPFSYDMRDPYGRNINNKLLATYLQTRKGNCVSMPILFLLLGERIGLDLTLALAPQHVLVKYRDDTGTYHNIETTSGGGFARDVWVRQQMPMSDRAIQNGIYMRPLSKRQVAIVMMDLLNEHYDRLGLDQERIALAELLKQHDPTYINATLHIASASQRLWQLHSSQPQLLQTTYHYLEKEQRAKYHAMALGWQMEPHTP